MIVTIKITRVNFETELTGKEQKHKTETEMDNYNDFDYEVINDTIEQYEKDIYEIYKKEENK